LNVGLSLGLNILFVLKFQWGVEGVLLANVWASGVLFIFTFPIVAKRINLRSITQPVMRAILMFGLPFLPAGILNMIMELADRYLLAWLADTASVGLYSAGYKLGLLGLIVVTGFNMGWTPYFLKRGKESGARLEFAHVATIFLGVLGFIVTVVNIWIPEIMRIQLAGKSLIGPEFWAAEQVVGIILVAYFIHGTYIIQLPGVFLKELTSWVVGFRAVGAGVNVGLNIILIPLYGVEGAAWATVIAQLCMSSSVWARIRNVYPVPYNIRAWAFPLLFIGFSFVLNECIAPRLLLSLAYLPLWFLLALNPEEKQIVKSFLP
jgi:O-antigen/teichoic acid export membrane protein